MTGSIAHDGARRVEIEIAVLTEILRLAMYGTMAAYTNKMTCS